MSYRILQPGEYAAGASNSGTADQLGANPVVAAADVGATERVKLFFILVQATGDTTTTVTVEDTDGNEIISAVVTADKEFVYAIPIELVTPGVGLQLSLSAANEHRWSVGYHVA